MFGAHVDTLSVHLKTQGKIGPAVWKKVGTQGDRWRYAQVRLNASRDFQVCGQTSISQRPPALAIFVVILPAKLIEVAIVNWP